MLNKAAQLIENQHKPTETRNLKSETKILRGPIFKTIVEK